MNQKMKIYCLLLIGVWSYSGALFAQDWIYTTRPGDNLWNISKNYLNSANDWKKLKKYNDINIPKQLSPGIRLRIPVAWLKNQPEGVTIVYTRGVVQVVRSDGKKQSLKVNDQLHIGDKIVSGENAAATLRFADESIILLESESELLLDSLSYYKNTGMVDTQLRLQRGGLETQVIPLRKSNSRFEIITPAAVAAVRGTRYRVEVDAINHKLMRTEVLEGKVNLATTKADQSVDMGYGSLAEQGKRPLPPRKLLPGAELGAIPNTIRKLPSKVYWPILEGAKLYRIQVVTSGENESTVFDEEVKEPTSSLDNIPDGRYSLKIRGIDELGLEGNNGVSSITVDTSLYPALAAPVLNEPSIDERKITYSWQVVDNAEFYIVEVATELDFKNIIQSEKVAKNEFTIDLAEEYNNAYFRVKPISEFHHDSSFNEAQEVKIEEHGILYFVGSVLLIMLL